MRQLFFFINDSPLETGPNWIGFFRSNFGPGFFRRVSNLSRLNAPEAFFCSLSYIRHRYRSGSYEKPGPRPQIIAFGASCPAFRFSFSGCPLPAPPAACYWPITTLVDRPYKPTFSGLQGHFCPSNNTMFERRYRDVNRS